MWRTAPALRYVPLSMYAYGADGYAAPGMNEVVLEVDNVRVRVRSAPPYALHRMNEQLAYLSPAAREAGFEEPIHVDHGPDAADLPHHQYDGMIRFLRVPDVRKDGTRALPWFETGLLERAMSSVASLGLAVRVYDFRRRPDSDHDVPRFWPPSDVPPFSYQEVAVDNAFRAGRGVIVAPPRAGKTRILLELCRRLNLPVLWIAPTTSIVDQTVEGAHEYGYAKDDAVLLSSRTDWEKAREAWIWVTTAAKATRLDAELAKTRAVIVCDELHHYTKGGTWGRALHKLFPHVFHWYGASGTYFRSAGDDMSLEAFLSGVVFRISSAELLALGRLVPTRVAFCPVEGPGIRRGGDHRKEGLIYHDHRNGLGAAAALHFAGSGRRTLVFVAEKEQGRRVLEMVNKFGPGGTRRGWRYAEFLYRGRGHATDPDRDRVFRKRLIGDFLAGEGPAVLLGTSLLGEGVDLPDADAAVDLSGVSAIVSELQRKYRVCTAREGKIDAIVLDFADRHHPKLLENSIKRLGNVASDPVFRPEVLGSAADVGAWSRRTAA